MNEEEKKDEDEQGAAEEQQRQEQEEAEQREQEQQQQDFGPEEWEAMAIPDVYRPLPVLRVREMGRDGGTRT